MWTCMEMWALTWVGCQRTLASRSRHGCDAVDRRNCDQARLRGQHDPSSASASRRFLEWIQASVRRIASVSGAIQDSGGRRQPPDWLLRYTTAESIRPLGWSDYTYRALHARVTLPYASER